MGIAITGIRIENLTIKRDKEDAKLTMDGTYTLIGNEGRVLARQTFGESYGAMTVTYTQETLALCQQFMTSVKQNIQTTLGLEE